MKGLFLMEEEKYIVMENENVRIVFHRSNGSIREILNKETGQYLSHNAVANSPFVAYYYKREVNIGKFSYSLSSEESRKQVEFVWSIRNGTRIIADAWLEESDNKLQFDVRIEGNVADDCIISVEYPIINEILPLYADGSRDEFISPFATGFIFNNPSKNFNDTAYNFSGIDKTMGIYPSGWEYPMQFMAYITRGLGGFYVATNDGGCTVKSFSFTAIGNGKLRAGVSHYLDDIGQTNVTFPYQVQITNLTRGDWEEAGDRYLAFAREQEWTKQGLLENRQDINRQLFEDTVLVNFGINSRDTETPNTTSDLVVEQRERLYESISGHLKGHILNIYSNAWQRVHTQESFNSSWESYFPASISSRFQQQIRDHGDEAIEFEFNTLYNLRHQAQSEESKLWKSRSVQTVYGGEATFSSWWGRNGDTVNFWYICPSFQEWIDFCLQKDEEFLKTYDADGLYHDVGTAAVAPLQCWNKQHSHGSRVNIIPEYVEIERLSKELAVQYGKYSVGQELIYEQLLPYVDFFQGRANGGLLSWMENDRIRDALEAGFARKLPLFDYVYHAYGGLRVDGFMSPFQELGDGYYHAMAFTVLNGGLPEYNWEFTPLETAADKLFLPYVDFLDELGKARTEYGKEFLVYGQMTRTPRVSDERVSYNYFNKNSVYSILEGTTQVDRVVASAFEHDGKIGIFMTNIAEEDTTANFILEAGWLYNITEGEVKIYNTEQNSLQHLSDISAGEAVCSVSLPSRTVVMLVIER